MTIGKRYKVICMRSVQTRYGIKPVVDLQTGESIFLPAKYAKAIAREDLSRFHLSARYTYLTFYGTEHDQWNTPILKFTTGDEPNVVIEPTTFQIPNIGRHQEPDGSAASHHSDSTAFSTSTVNKSNR